MTIHEIVKDKKTVYHIHHPIVGYVRWDEECHGGTKFGYFMLMFDRGHDKDKPLIVDEAVMFCDQWVELK